LAAELAIFLAWRHLLNAWAIRNWRNYIIGAAVHLTAPIAVPFPMILPQHSGRLMPSLKKLKPVLRNTDPELLICGTTHDRGDIRIGQYRYCGHC